MLHKRCAALPTQETVCVKVLQTEKNLDGCTLHVKNVCSVHSLCWLTQLACQLNILH